MDMTVGQALKEEGSRKLIETYLPGLAARVCGQNMAMELSIRKLLSYQKESCDAEQIRGLELELERLNELHSGQTEEEAGKIAAYLKIAEQYKTAKETGTENRKRYDAIRPGAEWLDTMGHPIQAHGGALFYEDGTWYWYGENKEHTDGVCDIWTWGIRAYASTDLYNWRDLGLIIEPDVTDPDSPLFPEKRLDRPHIIKCAATGTYVCWIKLSGTDACFVILQADAFCGPYRLVRKAYRPFGFEAGDFDITTDEEGRAYLFMDGSHSGIYGIRLSEDALTAERIVSRQYENLHAPFCREGVAVFSHGGKKYMLTSGMTGYLPNQSDLAVADGWEETFVSIGNPHEADETDASFNSQISFVYEMPGEDRYIALADRWVPDDPVDRQRADLIRRAVASRYEPDRYPVTEEEREIFRQAPMLKNAATSRAGYVWLPVLTDGGRVRIEWKDFWRV